MSNLTFDDGEPIDISKFQNLYKLVLDLQGDIASNTIQNQNIKLIPVVYSGSTSGGLVLKSTVGSITIDYSAASLEAGARPNVVVTPRLSTVDKVKPGAFSFFVTDVTSSSAKIAAYATSKILEGSTINFDYIVVYMKQRAV